MPIFRSIFENNSNGGLYETKTLGLYFSATNFLVQVNHQ